MLDKLINTQSDINEHLSTLRDLASECTSVTEMGMRYIVSTWAFIEGLKEGGNLVSIDIKHPSFYGGDITKVEEACKAKGIDFSFIEGDTLEVTIKPTDLLFLDTIHTEEQVRGELKKHASKAKKYIAFHDTVSYPELWKPINELVEKGKWKVKANYTNNNGLTILQRCS